MQRRIARPAASPGITNSTYGEADVSRGDPENQAIITVLVSTTGQKWLHNYVQSAWHQGVNHCMKGWLQLGTSLPCSTQRNRMAEQYMDRPQGLDTWGTESYRVFKHTRWQRATAGKRSKDGRHKTAGSRPQKGMLHSLSPWKKNCLPRMIGELPNIKRHSNSSTLFVLTN